MHGRYGLRRLGLMFGLAAAVVAACASSAFAAPGDITGVDLKLRGSTSLPSPGLDGETKPRGKNGDVAVLGNTAFVGGGSDYNGVRASTGRICTDFGGVKVVDLTDPSSPTVTRTIPLEDTTGVGAPWLTTNPRRAEAAAPTSRRFNNVAVTATGLDVLSVSTPSFTGDLLAVSIARCEPNFFGGGGFEFWNVTDRNNPVRLSRFSSATPGTVEDVRLVKRGDQIIALGVVALGKQSGNGGDLRVLNVTDPAVPTQIGEFPPTAAPVPTLSSDNGCQTFIAGRSVTPSPDGNRAILSFYDGTPFFGTPQSAALINLDLDNLPQFAGGVFNPVPPTWGYPYNNPNVEGNAADVQALTGPGGKLLTIASEDDNDPSLTNLSITAPSSAATSSRACESLLAQRLHQLPGQQVSGQVAYLGRGCPASTLTGTANVQADEYLDNPSGRIALLDGGPSPFDGCSQLERFRRAIDAGAVAVMANVGEEIRNTTNNGPVGGAAQRPVMTILLSAYRKMQLVPGPVLSGTTFPTTYERSSATNVSLVAFPASTRTDKSRFQSVANATDRVASAELNSTNSGASSLCDAGSCRFPVTAGQSYKASAFVAVSSYVAGTFRTLVRWYDAAGAQVGTDDVLASRTANTTRARFESPLGGFTAPVGAVRGTVRFEWTGAAAEGTAFVDTITVVPSGLEATLKDNQDAWGAQRIVDFSQSPPAEIGSYRSPTSKSWPPPDNGIYGPSQARLFSNEVALATWMSDGLRVLDMSKPEAPREVGSFVPPAANDPSPDAGAGSTLTPPLTTTPSLELNRGRAWPDRTLVTSVDVLSRSGDTGTVVISDINGGLYVLDMTIRREGQPTPTPTPNPTPRPTPTATKVEFKKSFITTSVKIRRIRSRRASSATYLVTVSGRFRTTPCAGRIRFTASAKGSKKVSSIASIKSNCTFRKSFTYRTSSRTARRAKLRIGQAFLGNTRIRKGRAKTLAVRLK